MPVQCISRKRTAVLEPGVNWRQHVGYVGAGEPPGLRCRQPEPDDVDQSGRGATPVQHLHQVRQRVPPVVAGGRRQRPAPLAQLLVDRRRVLLEDQRAEVTEALDPESDVVAAVRDARKLAIDLFQIPFRIVGQGVACAGRKRPQARAQLVAPRSDGLQRGVRGKTDLALDPVHLDGRGKPVAVLVDALGDADPAPGWRSGGARQR